ncbi:monocopper oxidase-like protein SKU5 [Cucumis melo var. makuwa]|uniref:Monocopper oxidase-like protein SKU5 n=1 Tax=Cucumis melo var. makuwa TaxID=1194695 RepID=A0A5A7T018_CUCMM|nr:monocopper oxidase-like protein SKU5 [Cucumis melo var. makuwa]TYK09240.1 monocopper oxidase-like protein SKU5 [Cucumis melo var. makuwa]
MAFSGFHRHPLGYLLVIGLFALSVNAIDIFLEWNVTLDSTIQPASQQQPVIAINGLFPGPLINTTTNDFVHVNVFNNLDEPLLFTWNGIQQRLNSWQDGVSGTNCPILPGTNWTFAFQTKDQIGSFFYFPSINFQKAAGGFGPIRINNRNVIAVPFPKPEDEFDLLIGDWSFDNYKVTRSLMTNPTIAFDSIPNIMLMNGKPPFGNPEGKAFESFTVTQGKVYRFRISNVGTSLSFNFRIQNHNMLLVETEGSYTNQTILDSLDVHVGQSYSVLVTANQVDADYFIVASPKLLNATEFSSLVGVGVLHYSNSAAQPVGPLPTGPDPFDLDFSVNQAKSIRQVKWNMTTGAARPNPQGTFNVTNVTISQTFVLENSVTMINGLPQAVVNNVSYLTIDTPLKLADFLVNGSGVYQLDEFPVQSVNLNASFGVSVATGNHKGWIEIVLKNNWEFIDSWHLDGFGFYTVGFGNGDWTPELRNTYNLFDPVVRSTVQVYPGGWTAVYAFLDNPGMWNLRSQLLKNWFLGQELYLRVHDSDPNPAKERPPPENLLLCGVFNQSSVPASVHLRP